MIPQEFIDRLAPDALRHEQETGLPAAVTIAQAALETGWGRTPIVHQVDAERALRRLEGERGEYNTDLPDGTPSFNLFGIKRHRSGVAFVVCWDHEFVQGRLVSVPDRFRRYASYAESIADRYEFLRRNPRYAHVLATRDPFLFATRLQEAGYATDPAYARKLHSIMRVYVLPRLKDYQKRRNESAVSSLSRFWL